MDGFLAKIFFSNNCLGIFLSINARKGNYHFISKYMGTSKFIFLKLLFPNMVYQFTYHYPHSFFSKLVWPMSMSVWEPFSPVFILTFCKNGYGPFKKLSTGIETLSLKGLEGKGICFLISVCPPDCHL